jgi:hypothetical protein
MSKSIQERLKSLERQYKGLCCKVAKIGDIEPAGCITITDITWTEFITAIDNGSIADCYYNITDRPNSGTDPLYVLVERGLPNFDNEVRRGQQALASLCLGEQKDENGCYNIYSVSSSEVIPTKVGCGIVTKCAETIAEVGDMVVFPDLGPTEYEIVSIYKDVIFFNEDCPEIKGERKFLINGTECIVDAIYRQRSCKEPLSVGMFICSDNDLQATITSINPITGAITFEPTSGSWIGVSFFWPCEIDKPVDCFYIMPPIAEPTSTPLNSEPICFEKKLLGYKPYSSQMLLASDNNLYGVLTEGGRYGQLYSINPTTDLVEIVYEFNNNNLGVHPATSLVEEAGIIYGTCVSGGTYGFGSLWSYEIATQTFTFLYGFETLEGAYPYSGLVIVSGTIYGVCQRGGLNEAGTLWSYEISTNTFTLLKDLKPENVYFPQGTLVEVLPNKLWGTSYEGGIDNWGTVFQYDIITDTISIIYSLGSEGLGASSASGGVFLASNGNVYLQTYKGDQAGLLIEISNIGTTNDINVVYNFNAFDGGYSDAVRPVEIAGVLYGVCSELGNNDGRGTLWSYNLTTETFTLLHTFTQSSEVGFDLFNSLQVVGTNLYGLTNSDKLGFTRNTGSIFKFNTLTQEISLVKYLDSLLGSPEDIALITCAALDNPDYVCTVIGNCVYITGSQYAEDNGSVIEVRTVYTLDYIPDSVDPTVGDILLLDDGSNDVLGTIVDVQPSAPHIKVEWTYPTDPYGLITFNYIEQNSGSTGEINGVSGSQLVQTTTPFTGGDPFPRNVPCYYNAKADVIVDYPMSQAFTKAQVQKFIEDQTLVPGAFYYIKGLDPSLYGGTTCILQADSPNRFNPKGIGLFHTPDYSKYPIFNKEVGSGQNYTQGSIVIWGGQMWVLEEYDGNPVDFITPYLLTSQFNNNSSSCVVFVNANSATGSWSIGDVVDFQGSSATILDLYIDEVNIGYSYLILDAPYNYVNQTDITNITSGGSISLSNGEMPASMFPIPDYTGYIETWEEIIYDQDFDFITFRQDISLNSVQQLPAFYSDYGAPLVSRSIRAFQWGNPFSYENWIGLGNNKVDNAIFETINAVIDMSIYNNTVINFSFVSLSAGIPILAQFSDNTFRNSYFQNNTFDTFWSSFNGNTLNSSGLSQCVFIFSFNFNTLNSSYLQVTIQFLNDIFFEKVVYFGDISTATIIYGTGVLRVMRDQLGATKVVYLNGLGNIVSSDITV